MVLARLEQARAALSRLRGRRSELLALPRFSGDRELEIADRGISALQAREAALLRRANALLTMKPSQIIKLIPLKSGVNINSLTVALHRMEGRLRKIVAA